MMRAEAKKILPFVSGRALLEEKHIRKPIGVEKGAFSSMVDWKGF
jgi:hypothetical protein